ncbi:MAG: AsmA family protein, partial [Brevundimonas sp.]
MPNTLKDKLNWPFFRDRALVPAGVRVKAWRDSDPFIAAVRLPGRTEKVVASITLLLILAIVVFLMLFDWNWLRGPIGQWASAKYDREIQLNGDLDVTLFSWTPSVQVRGLRIGGPDWARERDTLNVADLQASARLRALLVGRIEMPLVAITRPEVVLIATDDGRQSWDLNPDAPDTGEGLKLPPINQLIIRDGTVSLDEQRRNVRLEATISAREGSDGDAGFTLDGQGTINDTPLTLVIEGGPFINIRRDRPYGFRAALSGVNSRLEARGSITRPFDLGQFQATLSLQGRDLADLYLLTG